MPTSSPLLLLLPLLLPILGGYLFKVRPQQRERRRVEALQANLAAGDHVVTWSGLHAAVVDLGASTVELECCSGVVNRYDRSCIARLLEVATPATR